MGIQLSGTHEAAPQKFVVGEYDLNAREDVERAFSDWRDVAEKNGKMSEYQNLRDLIRDLILERSAGDESAGDEVDTEKIRQLFEIINTKDESAAVTDESPDAEKHSNVVYPDFKGGGINKVPFSQDAEKKTPQEDLIPANDNMPEHESTVKESPQEDLIAANDNVPDSKTESGAEKISKEEIQEKRDVAKRLLIGSTGGGIHKFLAIPDVDRVYKKEYFVSLTNLNEYLWRFDDLTDEERSNLPEMVVTFEKAVDMVISAYKKHHDAETAADDNEIESEEPEEIEVVDEHKELVKAEIKEIPHGVIELKAGESPWDVIMEIFDESNREMSKEMKEKIVAKFFDKLRGNNEEMMDAIIYKPAVNDNERTSNDNQKLRNEFHELLAA